MDQQPLKDMIAENEALIKKLHETLDLINGLILEKEISNDQLREVLLSPFSAGHVMRHKPGCFSQPRTPRGCYCGADHQ